MNNKSNDIIDFETYDELLKYASKAGVLEIYKEFEIETGQLLGRLKSLNLENDCPEILSILHTIKGNAASLGLIAMAEYSEQSERAINESRMSNENDIYTKLLEFYCKFTDNYERLLKLW
uniref:Hpt domain-containing protein n=1 Tax=Roseivirga sp. TaxID=1964215 RepID=UPI00404820A0